MSIKDTALMDKAHEIAFEMFGPGAGLNGSKESAWLDGSWILYAALMVWSPDLRKQMEIYLSPAYVTNQELATFCVDLELVTGKMYTYRYLRQILTGSQTVTDNLFHYLADYIVKGGKSTVGARIRYWRKAKDITQIELADLTGLSNTYISDIENERTEPPLRTIRLFATAFDVSIARILDGIE